MLETFDTILSERRTRECTNKTQYTSAQSASRARKRMEGRFPSQQFTEYSCEFCGTWHIGHTRYQHMLKKRA
jgi:hypothetical protein